MNDVLNLIDSEMRAIADVEKSSGMTAYMKNNFPFLGVSAPDRKVVVRFCWQEHKAEIKAYWRDLTLNLWSQKQREFQYCAMDIMIKVKSDIKKDDISMIQYFVTEKSWWDTVDFIATHMAGKYFEKYPEEIPIYIDSWMRSTDMWLARTAILFQLKYADKTNFELLKENVLFHIDSKEFFIRKACGWALRQYSKVQPDLVKSFVNKTPELSNLTKREALKYL